MTTWLDTVRRLVVVGVGNSMRKDDNIGVEVVRGLEGRVPKSVLLIESETIPEEHLQTIVDFSPSHILIIDAAFIGTGPGSVRLVEHVEPTGRVVSTHFLPIQIFNSYLARAINAKIAMLLIQPKDTSFGEGLTHEISSVGEKLIDDLAMMIRRVIK